MEMVNKKMRDEQSSCRHRTTFAVAEKENSDWNSHTHLNYVVGFRAVVWSQNCRTKERRKSMMAWHCIRQLQHFIGDKMMVLLAMTEGTGTGRRHENFGVRIDLSKEGSRARTAESKNCWTASTQEGRTERAVPSSDWNHSRAARLWL